MVDDDGAYRRVLRDAQGSNLLEVRQSAEDALTVRIGGAQPERWLESLVVRNVAAIDPRLDPKAVYSQVPAFSALIAS